MLGPWDVGSFALEKRACRLTVAEVHLSGGCTDEGGEPLLAEVPPDGGADESAMPSDVDLGSTVDGADYLFCHDVIPPRSLTLSRMLVRIAETQTNRRKSCPRRRLSLGSLVRTGHIWPSFLLEKAYEVHGLIRRASTFNTGRIEHLFTDPHEQGARLFLHYADLTEASRLVTLLSSIAPDEVYNLAAQSTRCTISMRRAMCESASMSRMHR
jgi:GDP-mannose 4,6 dehydratase